MVRYMAAGKSSQRATLENELRAVRAVFQICRGEVGLETGVSGLDPYLEVKRTAVLYEACQHGLELLHGGVDLRRLVLFRQREDLQYYFLDRDERVYGGTIYAEGRHPSTETEWREGLRNAGVRKQILFTSGMLMGIMALTGLMLGTHLL